MQSFNLPDTAVEKLKHIFKSYPDISKVWLYGSRAMGTHRTGSDIDLCIEANSLTTKQLLQIENEIDDLLLPWKVDLSLKHQIDNEALLDHIKKVAVVFYQRPFPE